MITEELAKVKVKMAMIILIMIFYEVVLIMIIILEVLMRRVVNENNFSWVSSKGKVLWTFNNWCLVFG